MEQLPSREWIRAEEAAAYLQVGKATVYRYIKDHILVGKQPKRRGPVFVLTESIRKALEQRV